MLKRHGQADVTDANVLALREPLSAFVSAWVNSSDAADDIVQETLTRVLECRSRLELGRSARTRLLWRATSSLANGAPRMSRSVIGID